VKNKKYHTAIIVSYKQFWNVIQKKANN
jgi:hypothetical protein